MKGKRGAVDSAFLEGNAQNIATYELVPDLQGDPFVIGYHVPQGVGWRRGWDRRKRWGFPNVCNITPSWHPLSIGSSQDMFLVQTTQPTDLPVASCSES